MQQDVGGVDSTANAIRRIARSVGETGHNRIAAGAGPTVAAGRLLPCRFVIDPTSQKWPISAISLINILDVERRSAACDRHRLRVSVGASPVARCCR